MTDQGLPISEVTLTELLGPPPSPERIAAAVQWNVEETARRVAACKAASVTPPPKSAVITMELDGAIYAPLWQFDEDGCAIEGVGELADKFPGDVVDLHHFMMRPSPSLVNNDGGRERPINLLTDGRLEELLSFVNSLGVW